MRAAASVCVLVTTAEPRTLMPFAFRTHHRPSLARTNGAAGLPIVVRRSLLTLY